MPDDLRDEIETNAAQPRRMRNDEGEVEQQPLKDQIAADRYLDEKTAVDASGGRGLRFSRFKPPGGTGVHS